MLVADGHAVVDMILIETGGVTVSVEEEEPDDTVGGADGDVIHIKINSPNRAGEHL